MWAGRDGGKEIIIIIIIKHTLSFISALGEGTHAEAGSAGDGSKEYLTSNMDTTGSPLMTVVRMELHTAPSQPNFN